MSKRLTPAQKSALQIVNDGGELVYVAGNHGGWILKDKDDNKHPIRWATARAIEFLLARHYEQFGVTRYRSKEPQQ